MASRQTHRVNLQGLDIFDRAFPRQSLLWSIQTRSEIDEIIIKSNEAIAASHSLMSKIDRVMEQLTVFGSKS